MKIKSWMWEYGSEKEGPKIANGSKVWFLEEWESSKIRLRDTAQLCNYIKQPLNCALKMGELYGMQIISIKLLKMKKERMKVFKKNNNPATIQWVSENKLWQAEWHFPTNNTFILISAPCTSRSLFKDEGMDYSECFPKWSLL